MKIGETGVEVNDFKNNLILEHSGFQYHSFASENVFRKAIDAFKTPPFAGNGNFDYNNKMREIDDFVKNGSIVKQPLDTININNSAVKDRIKYYKNRVVENYPNIKDPVAAYTHLKQFVSGPITPHIVMTLANKELEGVDQEPKSEIPDWQKSFFDAKIPDIESDNSNIIEENRRNSKKNIYSSTISGVSNFLNRLRGSKTLDRNKHVLNYEKPVSGDNSKKYHVILEGYAYPAQIPDNERAAGINTLSHYKSHEGQEEYRKYLKANRCNGEWCSWTQGQGGKFFILAAKDEYKDSIHPDNQYIAIGVHDLNVDRKNKIPFSDTIFSTTLAGNHYNARGGDGSGSVSVRDQTPVPEKDWNAKLAREGKVSGSELLHKEDVEFVLTNTDYYANLHDKIKKFVGVSQTELTEDDLGMIRDDQSASRMINGLTANMNILKKTESGKTIKQEDISALPEEDDVQKFNDEKTQYFKVNHKGVHEPALDENGNVGWNKI